MKRRTFLASAGVIAAGTLSGCVAEFVGPSVSETFSSSHPVAEEAVVAVGNRNGPVTVERASGDELTVSGEKRADSQAGVDSVTVEVVEGERFAIDVRFGAGSDFSNRSVDLTVGVPEGVSVERAATANGDVSMTGVRGDLTAATKNGNVEVTDVTGYVRGENENGDVRIRNATGVTGARTTNGNVDVELRAMQGDVACRSSSGDVTVRVGPDVSAGIRLSTNTGSADVRDLPYAPTTDRKGRIVGALRGGESPALSLETDTGDVTLQPV